MDLSPFPSYLQQAPASPGRCSLSSKTAGHGQLKDGLSQVPCTGVSAFGSHHYIIQASSSACCSSSFSSSSKNIPSSDLGHLSRCENCSTHFFRHFGKRQLLLIYYCFHADIYINPLLVKCHIPYLVLHLGRLFNVNSSKGSNWNSRRSFQA